MKISQVVFCGLLAFGLTTANAQNAQLSQNAVKLMQESQIAKRFLEQRLGVRTGTLTDVNAALSKLSPAERAGVVAAINAYSAKAAVANGNVSIASQNEQAARAAFTVGNGELIQVASLAQGQAATTATSSKLPKNSCDASAVDVTASKLAEGTVGASFADAQSVIQKGIIRLDQNCTTAAADMKSADARGNLIKIAKCAEGKDVLKLQAAAERNGVYAACAAEVAGIPAADMNSAQAKCGYLY